MAATNSSSFSAFTDSARGSSPVHHRPIRPSSRRGDEPLDVPPQWGWADEIEAPPDDWWVAEKPAWEAPVLAFDDGRVLVLDAEDPVSADEWPVYTGD